MSTTAQASCSDPPQFDLSGKDVEQLAEELIVYHQHFVGLFFRKEQRGWVLKYLEGLLLPSEGKSIESLALKRADTAVEFPMPASAGRGDVDRKPAVGQRVGIVDLLSAGLVRPGVAGEGRTRAARSSRNLPPPANSLWRATPTGRHQALPSRSRDGHPWLAGGSGSTKRLTGRGGR
jgi:hypothetical protein